MASIRMNPITVTKSYDICCIIMSAMEMINTGKTYTRDEIRKNLSGHLCRCTGYQNVIDGVEKAIEIVHGECGTEE